MKNIISFITSHLWLVLISAVILGVGIWFMFFRVIESSQITTVVQPKDFVSEVSISGTVVAAESVDLGFAGSGRISKIYAKVGDVVEAGAPLAEIENGDLRASVAQRSALLRLEQVTLEKLQQGSTRQELAVDETALNNAKSALVQTKITQDTLVDNAFKNLLNSNPEATLKDDTRDFEAPIITGTYNSVVEGTISISTYGSQGGHSMRITGLVTGTESVKSVDPQPLGNSGLYITFPESVADKNLEWEINIPNKKASDYQENYNLYQEAIQTRNQTIQAAEASIKTAEAGLGLKSSGTRPADINVQNAQVNGAYAELQNAQAQLAKTIVSAPFGGVVTKMDAKVGEIVSTETSGISLISTGIFQIESNVPEVYVAQIKVENTANITLDAYGEGVSFEAKVVAIDPAPTLVDGVSNYKTTLQFLSADDRIRSGMTAKSKIITSSIANTFVVPHSAILTVNGEKFIDVMEDTQAVRRKVSVGASSLTEIQIIDGLNDGDVVVLNPVTP